jgi:acyl transferase domain-containing protein
MGVPVANEAVWAREQKRLPLPTYAFQHSRFWVEPTAPDLTSADDRALVPERLTDFDQWLSGPRWVQQGLRDDEAPHPQTWCVIHNQDPIAEQCVLTLRKQGHKVVEVLAGDTFSRIDDKTFTLAPESGGAAYQALIEALVDADLVPDRVLHAWLLTRKETFRPGKSFLHRNQECGFYSLFYLARAFAKRVKGKRSHWIVFGNGCVSANGEPLAHPDKSTVLGAVSVIPRTARDHLRLRRHCPVYG